MHPVLKSALEPLAEQIASLSLEEAQTPPAPGQGHWCAQQIIEHLILTYQMTSDAVSRQLKTGRVPRNRRNLLEFFLRVQTIALGHMPNGVPAMRAVRPTNFTPQAGPELAARFMAAAEAMDALLVQGRKKFGIQACGEHPSFGVMRVDEWRRYHAVHACHHRPQLENAIRYARTQKAVESRRQEAAPPVVEPARAKNL
jgi:hypothetical protein